KLPESAAEFGDRLAFFGEMYIHDAVAAPVLFDFCRTVNFIAVKGRGDVVDGIVHATATSPGELHAPAKSESAKVNRNPPWAVRCPLHISGVMVKVPSQRPRDKEVMVMPRFAVARSSANMVR